MSNYLGFNPCDNPNYFFVSYNNEDADRVGEIAKRLFHGNIPLWYDYGIDYGEAWEPKISEKIMNAQAVILFFTKNILYKEHSYVHKEYVMATKYFNKKVYVIMMDDISNKEVPHTKVPWLIDIQSKQCININSIQDYDLIANTIANAVGMTMADNLIANTIANAAGMTMADNLIANTIANAAGMTMADNLIFISYSHKDSDFVKKAIVGLRMNNYNIWYDEGLECSSAYNNEIAIQIKNCDCFIAFMSNNYAVSSYCTTELEYALKCKKEILVAYIDDINEYDLPAGIDMQISRLQAIFRRDFATDADFITKICNEPIITKYKLCKTISELKGTEILNDNNEYSYTYTGETVDGKRYGKGKCTWSDGDVYEGEWIDDKRNGIGKLTATDGTYDGEWKDNQMDGKGKLCTDSYIYEGDWKDGRICGTGICTWKDGNGVYEGELKDGKFHGIGRFKCPNGDVYEGEWKDGQKYGKGKYTWSNGDVYDGEWIDGKQHGRGIYTCSDGTVYEGEWKDDNLNGKVRITYSNGKQKICSFRNGKKVLL